MSRISNNVSDNNQIVYQISLTSKDLGLVNPHLFVEKLTDEVASKLPNIKVVVVYNTKGKTKDLVNLQFFSYNCLPAYQINNLQEQISFIAANLKDELTDRIEDAQHSAV